MPADASTAGWAALLPAFLLVFIFGGLSLLHWSWLFRRGAGLAAVVPEVGGRPAFEPGKVATAAVALLLLLAAAVCASQAGLWGLERSRVSRLGVWALAVVFLLRALGDFRLVGFFKRVRGTRFARMDSWLYSPLCLVISALCLALVQATGGLGFSR